VLEGKVCEPLPLLEIGRLRALELDLAQKRGPDVLERAFAEGGTLGVVTLPKLLFGDFHAGGQGLARHLHVLGVDLLRREEIRLVFAEEGLHLLVADLHLGPIARGRDGQVRKGTPLPLEALEPLALGPRQERGFYDTQLQLTDDQRAPEALLEPPGGIALPVEPGFVPVARELPVGLKRLLRVDERGELLVTHRHSLVGRPVDQHRLLDHSVQGLALQAVLGGLVQLETTAHDGLKAITLLLQGLLELPHPDRGVVHLGHDHRAATVEILVDAPEGEGDDDHHQQDRHEPGVGPAPDVL